MSSLLQWPFTTCRFLPPSRLGSIWYILQRSAICPSSLIVLACLSQRMFAGCQGWGDLQVRCQRPRGPAGQAKDLHRRFLRRQARHQVPGPSPIIERPIAAGTPVESPYDFYSGYLKAITSFIGLAPIVAASVTTAGPDKAESLDKAHAAIDALDL